MFTPTLLLATTLLPLISAETYKSRTADPILSAALKTAATNFDRQALLKESDYVYDFSGHINFNSPNGAVIVADAASMPALTGQGMTVSLLKLVGCGMLPPHLHPRAANVVTAMTGNTTTYMIEENGVKTITTHLTPMKMTVFPAGSIHAMQNNDCEPAILVSALNSDDTGTNNLLTALWTMPADIIQAAFGKADMNAQDMGRDVPQVGTGAILGSAECKRRCGIK